MNEKTIAESIGEKIKYYRKLNKLTQRELGVKIKKSANTVSQYETGANAPSQDALFALADALGVLVDDFFPKREFSEKLNSSLKESDDFSIQEMESFRELTALLNTLDDTKRAELLRNADVAFSILKNTYDNN